MIIDGLWRAYPQGYRFDTFKWSRRRGEFRLRSTRLTGANLLAAAMREARQMGQNSTRLLMSATTAPIVNHLGQVVGPEPVDNYGCEICRWWSRTSPFPFPHCTYCGEQPAYHHGRCCPLNGSHSYGRPLEESAPDSKYRPLKPTGTSPSRKTGSPRMHLIQSWKMYKSETMRFLATFPLS